MAEIVSFPARQEWIEPDSDGSSPDQAATKRISPPPVSTNHGDSAAHLPDARPSDAPQSSKTQSSRAQSSKAQVAADLVRSIGLTGLVRTATTPKPVEATPPHGLHAATATPESPSSSTSSRADAAGELTRLDAAPSVRRHQFSRAGGRSGAREADRTGGPERPDAEVIPLVSGSLAHARPVAWPWTESDPEMPEQAAAVRRIEADSGTFPFLGEPDRILPVLPQLRDLLPARGLRRGSTVGAIGTAGATSLVIALLAEASKAGSWCAVVGLPTFGAIAASEAGIALDRLALVPHPGPEWTTIVAALLDGFDIVVAAPPGPVAATITGRLSARARQRGSVLVTYGQSSGADLVLRSTEARWHGLAAGGGRLLSRDLEIEVRGRGSASRPRSATLTMPHHTPLNDGWMSRTDWAVRDQQEPVADIALVPAAVEREELLEAAS